MALECVHCFHKTGFVPDSYPPLYEIICCLCGKKKTVGGYKKQTWVGHGPYHPERPEGLKNE